MDYYSPSRIVVTCAKGIADILADELIALGFVVTGRHVASVETRGTLVDTMKLNLRLRTAQRILYSIDDFPAKDAEELYSAASFIPWEKIIPPDGFITVDSAVVNDTIRDTRYPNVRLKDAIVDRMRKALGRRPDSGSDKSGSVVFLFWKLNVASIYLDTSGESLNRRGWRTKHTGAPLMESVAAAAILASGWDGTVPFINPMCGSGTFAIEAVEIAAHIPPGLTRKNFGFMHFAGYDVDMYKPVVIDAKKQIDYSAKPVVIASDLDPKAISAARSNATNARFEGLIRFENCAFERTTIPEEHGVIMFNPPYGVRMGEDAELDKLYPAIGTFLKQKCQGYKGCVFTGNLDLAKKIGLAPKRKFLFFNGPIECRLFVYEMYAGSRRVPKEPLSG